jgi:glycosyltransferase involved in cell wall biosynthesis
VPAKDFVVLSSFDFRSDFQRKNPLAGIEAFKCAFKPDTGATLILKSSNSAEFPEEFELVKQACANRTDIRLLNEILPVFENNLLLNCADVFLSLHRAEGYGINLIDSMARGIPVVATGFSGNLDYMNDANSVLVPFESKRVDFYAGVKVESTWAEPDINFASDKLRELFQDREMYSSISFQASKDIAKGHSLPMAVEQFRKEFTIA